MKLPITDHEYQINGGEWTGSNASNTTDNGDGTYTIHDGLTTPIPIGDLKVRVKAIGSNPASTALLNTTAFNAVVTDKNIQLLFLGDSITRGIGTTGSGFNQTIPTAVYNGPTSYPNQTIGKLTGLTFTSAVRGWTGQSSIWYMANDLNRTIAMFDGVNYTDTYCVVFFSVNDLMSHDDAICRTNTTTLCTSLKAAGAKVILVTAIDMQNTGVDITTYNARRATYNAWLLANYATIADGLADTTIYPDLDTVGAADNAIFFADAAHDVSGAGKIHPTDAGAELIARAVSDAIVTLSTTSSNAVTVDDDAANFITATGITNSGMISAIETMVTDLKAAKIWWKFRAIYPFVGGTADTHKFNLRDQRDLDVAYRLKYTGTAAHDSTGVTWVGGAYADTSFLELNAGDFDNSCISLHYYSRSNTSGGIDMGAFEAGVCWFGINNGGSTATCQLNNYAGGINLPYSNYTGLFSVCRANGDFAYNNLYRNGLIAARSAEVVQYTVPTAKMMIGINGGGLDTPSNRNCAYAAIGYGLTDAEEAAHYTIIQAFQTALGRAV